MVSMSQEFQKGSVRWFRLRSHMWLWSSGNWSLNSRRAEIAGGWPCILFTLFYVRASPCGLSTWASLGLPYGTTWSPQDSWTIYIAAQGSKWVSKSTRQTPYHFLWPSLRSHIASLLLTMQRFRVVTSLPRFKRRQQRPHFLKGEMSTLLCKNMWDGRYCCNHLWKKAICHTWHL